MEEKILANGTIVNSSELEYGMNSIDLYEIKRGEEKGCVRMKSTQLSEYEWSIARKRASKGLKVLQQSTESNEKKANNFLHWFVWPLPLDVFLTSIWENSVFIIKRKIKSYWNGWLTYEQFKNLLETGPCSQLSNPLDMDILISNDDSKCMVINSTSGLTYSSEFIWEIFEKMNCAIRIGKAQEQVEAISKMIALHEEFFLSPFTSQVVYAKAGSVSLQPLWLDIDTFVLQLEGKQHFKIYSPQSKDELLPTFPSGILTSAQLGEKVLEIVLDPGDMIYLPRGTIHESRALDINSMHLSICSEQKTWADMLSVALKMALDQATSTKVDFRHALPRDFADYLGVMHADLVENQKRKSFITKAMALLKVIYDKFLTGSIDDAADKLMCEFLNNRQPPQAFLSDYEQGIVDHENENDQEDQVMTENSSNDEDNLLDDGENITEESRFRLISKYAIRLVIERNASLYYATGNTSLRNEFSPKKIEMPLEYAEAIEFLYRRYPEYVAVKDLPLEDEEQRLDLANELLEKHIAMIY